MRGRALALVLAPLLALARPVQAAGTVDPCTEASLDTALVGGGAVTFACNGTITFAATKAITTTTSLDATGFAVTLSGNNMVRLFDVSVAGTMFTLTNLTLVNGRAQGAPGVGSGLGGEGNGGAISGTGAAVVATSCTFTGNQAIGGNGAPAMDTMNPSGAGGPGQGGAIYANSGSVTLTNCTFTSNMAKGGAGGTGFPGGLFSAFGGFAGNALGGAVATIGNASLTMTGGSATSNAAVAGRGGDGATGGPGGGGGQARGGAVAGNGGSVTISAATFVSNAATGGDNGTAGAGAMGFASNGGSAYGGAISEQGAIPSFYNLVVRGNAVTSGTTSGTSMFTGPSAQGGGIHSTNGPFGTTLTNCTFTANTTTLGFSTMPGTGAGGALYMDGGSVANCICYGDLAYMGGAEIALPSGPPPNVVVNNCDVQGGWSGMGMGTINVNPQFVSATNLRIQMGSACRDTGGNLAATSLSTDIAGDPRIYPMGGTVDMGAYEYAPLVLSGPAPGTETACAGNDMTQSISVTSGQLPYSYQWRKGGMGISDAGNISGTQTATLHVNPASAGDSGVYDVVVTDGSATMQTSPAAFVTITADTTAPMVTAPSDATITQTLCQ